MLNNNKFLNSIDDFNKTLRDLSLVVDKLPLDKLLDKMSYVETVRENIEKLEEVVLKRCEKEKWQ